MYDKTLSVRLESNLLKRTIEITDCYEVSLSDYVRGVVILYNRVFAVNEPFMMLERINAVIESKPINENKINKEYIKSLLDSIDMIKEEIKELE